MKKYELIKEYPGSPKLGDVAIKQGPQSSWFRIHDSSCIIARDCDKYPEFWKEIVEKDYEILSFQRVKLDGMCCTEIGQIIKATKEDKDFDPNFDDTVVIHSVKRLSDGEIFTIGDELHDNSFTDSARHSLKDNPTYPYDNIITRIDIVMDWSKQVAGYNRKDINEGTELMFQASNRWNNLNVRLSDAIKAKKPLFTSEDGVEIFKNDIYHYYSCTKKKAVSHIAGNTIDSAVIEKDYRIKKFSTLQAAWENHAFNAKIFSYNDIIKLIGNVSKKRHTALKVFVNQTIKK